MDKAQHILSEARAGGVTSTLQLSEYMDIPRTSLRRDIDREGVREELEEIYAENRQETHEDLVGDAPRHTPAPAMRTAWRP